MASFDTTMGGRQGAFPETSWSLVLSCKDLQSSARRSRLDRLLALYWRPVYRFIRAAFGKPVEDAKDLTQEFFCRIVESDLVGRYERDLGRFRHFLKSALKNFLAQEHRNENRQKRGGGQTIVSLDVDGLEREASLAGATAGDPEAQFERQWARDVVAQSVEKLRQVLAREGKEIYFKAYEAYELGLSGAESPTYDSVARALGISTSDVRNHLNAARARMNEIVVETVADSVTTPAELESELRELFPS